MVNWGKLFILFDEKGQCVHASPSRKWNRFDFLQKDYKYVQQESTLWRRSLWDKVGGINPELKLAGDFDLWLKFSRHEKLYVTNALIEDSE